MARKCVRGLSTYSVHTSNHGCINNHQPSQHTPNLLTTSPTNHPNIKQSKGRIVNMSSAAGVACGYPVTCAYSSSKHAMEVFTSALRQELRVWGITVRTYYGV